MPNMTPARTARLDDRALLRVTGPEARAFLNRLLSQEVETLAPGDLRHAALLTPQGRVLYDLFLFGEEDGVVVDVAASAREALLARLSLFKLRAAVEIAPDDGGVHALWGTDDAPEGWRRDPRTPHAGWRFAGDGPPPADAPVVTAADAHAHRFDLGLAEAVADGLSDRAYATELNLDLLHGVDFSKGCFVGQETTSRMKRRGGMRIRVLPLDVEGAAARAEVLAGSLRAGEVAAAGPGRALALLRLDRSTGPLTVDGRPARLSFPAWLPADLVAARSVPETVL